MPQSGVLECELGAVLASQLEDGDQQREIRHREMLPITALAVQAALRYRGSMAAERL